MHRVHALRPYWLALLLSIACVGNVAATVRASVDREHVSAGGTVVLNVSSDSNAEPDFAPLGADFEVQGRSTNSQTSIINGRATSQQVWTIALSPRRSGTVRIPALNVGGERTDPIVLTVTDQPAPAASDGAAVFIESALDAEHPYVQQSVIYTVRLYYAVTLLDGSLDAPPTDGIDVRQLGDDAQSSAVIGGRRYNVTERRYLLTPERSGRLILPAPSFRGRAAGDGFDGMFDGTAVGARGQPKTLDVRARPAQATEPWLPAQAIALIVDPPGGALHAGEPFTLTVKLSGEGVTAAQLSDPTVPQIPGAQVYPEASSFQDSVRDGRLLAERSRRFAVVPNATGALQIPPIVQSWWDVRNDHAAQSRAIVPVLQVLPGIAPTPAADLAAANSGVVPALGSSWWSNLRTWQLAALLLAIGWVATVLWTLSLIRTRAAAAMDVDPPGSSQQGESKSLRRGPTLARALALGDLDAIAFALLDAAPGPRAQHLGDVARRLDDPAQVSAVQALDAARWGNGDAAAALHALRTAFSQPPRWRKHRVVGQLDEELPPLYPH
jgi:hypothetical protein